MQREIRGSLGALTGARFLAALWVVLYHYVTSFRFQTTQEQMAYANGPLTPLEKVIWDGHLAVDFFFLLSGFILAYTYVANDGSLRGGRRAFWVARLARIYPVYLLGLVLGVWPFLASGPSVGTLLATVGTHVLLIHAWFPTLLDLDQPSWSLAVEACFYALFPLLLPPLARLRRRGLWLLLLGSWTLFTLLNVGLFLFGHLSALGAEPWWRNFARYDPVISLPEFVAGMALGLLFVRFGKVLVPAQQRRWHGVLADVAIVAVGLALAMTLVVLYDVHLPTGEVNTLGPVALPCFGALILLLAFQRGVVAYLLSLRPVLWLGEISYGIYIVHNPLWSLLVMTVVPWLHLQLDNVYLLVGWALLVLLVTGLSFHYLEQPARRAIRARWGRPAPVLAARVMAQADVTVQR